MSNLNPTIDAFIRPFVTPHPLLTDGSHWVSDEHQTKEPSTNAAPPPFPPPFSSTPIEPLIPLKDFESASEVFWSDEAMADAQIEHDQNPTAPTSAEIYAMCMESDTCDQFAKWLCKAAGVAFPPTQG